MLVSSCLTWHPAAALAALPPSVMQVFPASEASNFPAVQAVYLLSNKPGLTSLIYFLIVPTTDECSWCVGGREEGAAAAADK